MAIKTKVDKDVKKDYKVLDKLVSKAEIKAKLKDANETEYYVYDLFNESGVCMALNRYVLVDNEVEMPFEKPTKADDDILNHPVVDEPDEPTEMI